MTKAWVFKTDDVDWEALSELYRIAPLAEKSPQSLKTAFEASRHTVFVYEDGRLIGVGRGVADGVDCSYLCDVAVHPDHQSEGLGSAVVEKLIELSRGHKKIILYANPGKEGFYARFGFKRMNTAMAIFEDEDGALEYGLVRE